MTVKILILIATTLIWASVPRAEAQQLARSPRVGLLIPGTQAAFSTRIDAFQQGLKELGYVGYVEGQTILVEYRFADDKTDRLPDLIK